MTGAFFLVRKKNISNLLSPQKPLVFSAFHYTFSSTVITPLICLRSGIRPAFGNLNPSLS
ncbi:hypothetical protein CWO08_07815 [Vibrio sp. 10N.286.48.B8]|nr:hypothetical protein CWO08_07815 [Vibrio sp. 10N.286.48.B8]